MFLMLSIKNKLFVLQIDIKNVQSNSFYAYYSKSEFKSFRTPIENILNIVKNNE